MYQNIEKKLLNLTKVQKILLKENYLELKRQIFANLSITHLKLGNFQSCISYSEKVLEIDPENRKIHQRIAIAYQKVKDFENAYLHLKKVKCEKQLLKVKQLLTLERQKFLENCFGTKNNQKKIREDLTNDSQCSSKDKEEVQIVYSEPKKGPQMIIVNGEEFWLDI